MSATRDIQAVLREQVIPAGASRHGLVVGVERYRDSRLNLRCARADAQAIYDLMIDTECGLFPKENVKLLLDEEATTNNIWRSLAGLRKAAAPTDMVWIFFAGHAAPEGSSVFWVSHDADIDDLYSTALDRERIDKALSDIHASRVIMMLDCCHAAATAVQKNPTRSVLTPEQLFSTYKGEGRITLASSDGKEKSVELGDQGHGAFTFFLKQGLRGEADSDGDGVVTANELWDYLRNKVTEASLKAGNFQTPVLLGQMTHDLALTLNPMATQHKRRLEEVLRQHIGWDEKRELTTQEAGWCRNLIHDGPKSDDQWAVYEELERLVDGKALVGTIKRLVKIARDVATANTRQPLAAPPADRPVSRICPSCGKYLRVQASCAGDDVPCPGCKALLHVALDRSTLSIVQPAPDKLHKPKPGPPARPAAAPARPPSESNKEKKQTSQAVPAPTQTVPAAAPSPPPLPQPKPMAPKPVVPAAPRTPPPAKANEQRTSTVSPAELSAQQRRLLKWIAIAAIVSAAAIWGVIQLSSTSQPIRRAKKTAMSPSTNSDEAAGHFQKGNSAYDKKDYDQALAEFSEAIRLDPKDPIAYRNRGLLWQNKKEYDKALDDYNHAIQLDSNHASAYRHRANIWKDKGNYDNAIADYSEAIRINSNDDIAYFNRANIWLAKNEYDHALNDFSESIRVDTKYAPAYRLRGGVWLAKKEYDKALDDYNEAIRLDPGYADVYVNRGSIWGSKKEYSKALADYDEAIRLDPTNVYAQNLHAWLQATCEDAQWRYGKQAVEHAKSACELTKWKDSFYLDTLAAAYAEDGDFELALVWQRKVLNDPDGEKRFGHDGFLAAKRRLALYEAQKPYREATGSQPASNTSSGDHADNLFGP
jgi:tetratricopeptide (TPR) repeat protein